MRVRIEFDLPFDAVTAPATLKEALQILRKVQSLAVEIGALLLRRRLPGRTARREPQVLPSPAEIARIKGSCTVGVEVGVAGPENLRQRPESGTRPNWSGGAFRWINYLTPISEYDA